MINSANIPIMSYDAAAKNLNDLTYTDYFFRLMLLARCVYKWENLPNGIDEKWIERFLFTEGKAMFFNDEEKGFMVTKTAYGGMLNYYDEPTKLTPFGTNYTNQKPREMYPFGNECVLIRNNDEMIPTAYTLQLYALRLAEITRTIDINIEAQQTPVLITCTEKQRFSLMQAYRKWKGHEPVIVTDKNLGTAEAIQVMKADAPIVFDKLQIEKHEIWNEAMTFLGINNANMNKRERLVDDEVQANNEQIQLSASVMLKSREKAAEQINEVFGLNVKVSLRDPAEFYAMAEDMSVKQKDGEIDG